MDGRDNLKEILECFLTFDHYPAWRNGLRPFTWPSGWGGKPLAWISQLFLIMKEVVSFSKCSQEFSCSRLRFQKNWRPTCNLFLNLNLKWRIKDLPLSCILYGTFLLYFGLLELTLYLTSIVNSDGQLWVRLGVDTNDWRCKTGASGICGFYPFYAMGNILLVVQYATSFPKHSRAFKSLHPLFSTNLIFLPHSLIIDLTFWTRKQNCASARAMKVQFESVRLMFFGDHQGTFVWEKSHSPEDPQTDLSWFI